MIADHSRDYFADKPFYYTADDILQIAHLTIQSLQKHLLKDNLIFMDTDLLNLKIWLEYKGWHTPKWLDKHIIMYRHDLYLLMYPDTPWVNDPLRHNAHNREYLFRQFEIMLQQFDCNYRVIKGLGEERKIAAMNHIKPFL